MELSELRLWGDQLWPRPHVRSRSREYTSLISFSSPVSPAATPRSSKKAERSSASSSTSSDSTCQIRKEVGDEISELRQLRLDLRAAQMQW
jgi:hypothetical protein